VEKTVDGLSPRSYWRLDPLAQPSLGSPGEKFNVLVAGDGDGGVIDALRACLKNFDHGPFIDRVVEIASDFRAVLEEIEKAEIIATKWRQKSKPEDLEAKNTATIKLYDHYEDLLRTVNRGRENWTGPLFVNTLTRYLEGQLRHDVDVTYLGRVQHATSPESYTLNRVLGWLVERMPGRGFTWRQGSLRSVEPVLLDPKFNGVGPWPGYKVKVLPIKKLQANKDVGWSARIWQEVIVRYGAIRPLSSEFGKWGTVVHTTWQKKAEEALPPIDPGILQPAADVYFWERINNRVRDNDSKNDTKGGETEPRLKACVVPVDRANPNKKRKTTATANNQDERSWELHTIKIWVEDPPPETRWVKYNLHPYRNGIQRWANSGLDEKRKFSLRIFTHDDYWVSAELSGGRTIRGWLTQILEDRFDEEKKALRECASNLWKNGAYWEYVKKDAPVFKDPPVFVSDSAIEAEFERQLERESRLGLKDNSQTAALPSATSAREHVPESPRGS
jgi:hypothetical protein